MIDVSNSYSYNENYLNELKEDILRAGLIVPILVKPIEHGRYKCIDGKYRLLAYKKLMRPTIPCELI